MVTETATKFHRFMVMVRTQWSPFATNITTIISHVAAVLEQLNRQSYAFECPTPYLKRMLSLIVRVPFNMERPASTCSRAVEMFGLFRISDKLFSTFGILANHVESV